MVRLHKVADIEGNFRCTILDREEMDGSKENSNK